MKILILDDDMNRHNVFNRKLSNHLVTNVTTAKEAIEKLNTEKFDIVFLDHDLGGEVFVSSDQENTGYTVAKWLSEHRDRQPGRIIIHSLNPAGAGNMKNLLPSADVIPGAWNFLS